MHMQPRAALRRRVWLFVPLAIVLSAVLGRTWGSMSCLMTNETGRRHLAGGAGGAASVVQSLRHEAAALLAGLGRGEPSAGGGTSPPADPRVRRLFSRIQRDFQPFMARGITEKMVDQAYCNSRVQGFRFQVVGGRAYVAGQTESFQTRLLSVQRMLLAVSRRWRLPDVDMIIEQDDWPTTTPVTEECPERGPIITAAKAEFHPAPIVNHSHVVLAPDFTFQEWVETTTLGWGEMQEILGAAVAAFPWERRRATLFLLASPMGQRRALAPALHALSAGSALYNLTIDEWIHWPGHFLSLYQHCRYKYLCHIPGNTYSARLKYLLLCGSAVVFPVIPPYPEAKAQNLSSTFVEFWTHLLQDGEHLLMTDVPPESNSTAEIQAATARLVADDRAARAMGERARALMLSVLTPDRVLEYWYRVIKQHTELQRFHPRVHPDAMPLEEALLSKRARKWEARTCPRCRAAVGGHPSIS